MGGGKVIVFCCFFCHKVQLCRQRIVKWIQVIQKNGIIGEMLMEGGKNLNIFGITGKVKVVKDFNQHNQWSLARF